MSKQSSRWQACLTGAASILDLSGSPRRFRQLAPARRGDAEALAGDFQALGGDLERALVAYAKQLPASAVTNSPGD